MIRKKQKAVLKFIEQYQMKHGCSPTLREMREHFNVSSDNSILKHLKKLEMHGYIKKNDRPRGIKLLDSVKERLQSPNVKIPVLGSIPAGGPVLSEEYIEDYVSVGSDFVKNPARCFMLRVKGESMIDAGIHEGDLALADSKKEARNGDIVIALVDGENTVKRYRVEKGKNFLQPENKHYKNIYPENELCIQGVVIALLRTY